MRHEAVVEGLRALGVPGRLIAAVPSLDDDVKGLLVYGSRARGDSLPDSDLDLLALVSTQRPSDYIEDVAISYYTREQLETGIGTLFGAHLRRDAAVLCDPHGDLGELIQAMGQVDVDRVLQRSRAMSELFTNPSHDLPRYLPGLLREARYLLRSCSYAQAIEAGAPCFSVRELAIRHGDPRLAELLASRHADEPTMDEYLDCLDRLGRIIGDFPQSSHGSLDATVVNLWATPGDVLSMAFMALGKTGAEADYAEVEKILL